VDVPPEVLKTKFWLATPGMGFPCASFSTTVTASTVPEGSVEDARLKPEVLTLVPPGLTWTVACAATATPPIDSVKELAVPALLAVNTAV
jgi:hypothetical protein